MNWIWFASRSAIRYLTPASSPPTASAAPIVAAMAPSSMNGSWMKTFDAPTRRMMPVSRFRLSAESRIVVVIKRAAARSMIAATIGAALAVGGLLAGVKYLIADRLANQIQFINYVGSAEVWMIAPFLVAIAIIVATVASLVTLSRYTRV